MKRKMALFLALVSLIVFPLGTFMVTKAFFSMTMERERNRALSEEAAIARAVAMEISMKDIGGVFSTASTLQAKYGSDTLKIYLLYNNRPMAGAVLPDTENIDQLIQIDGRATLLDGENQLLLIAHRLSDEILLVVTSSVQPVYALKKDLFCLSAIVSAIGAFVSAIVAVVLSGAVLRPLSDLTRAAEKMALGQYDAALPAIRKDETGILTKAFIHMKNAVLKREEKILAQSEGRQELINALSHEMRSPLTAIVSGVRLLKTASLTQEEQGEILTMIEMEGMRLSKMDETLLLLTRLSEGEIEKEAFSALECAREAAGIFENVRAEGSDFTVLGSRELTIILLRNLIVNALRAGGKNVCVFVSKDRFCVSDDGCGMTEEEISHAFEPFYKADKARTRVNGGAGLGLSIVKRIAELHKAEIRIESEKGKGTRVIYNLDTSV
ncbi:MAG: HAMP domain-containing histidine kinase [Clostridiales bacterium]|nr:HAMP domain-containing histidine kinase [Clostridiales bacterium]